MRGTSWFHGNFGKFKILFFGTPDNKLVGIAGFTAYGPAEREVKLQEYRAQAAKAMEDNQLGMCPIVIFLSYIYIFLYHIDDCEKEDSLTDCEEEHPHSPKFTAVSPHKSGGTRVFQQADSEEDADFLPPKKRHKPNNRKAKRGKRR